MNRFLSFMLLLFLSVGFATAQEKHSDMDVKVDVTVVDVDGNPLPGATLKRSDRKVGVVADVDGKASMWVPKGSTLTVTYLGMKPKVFKVKGPISGNITLDNDDHTLNQVVVTGYTQTDIRKTTGSVSIVNSKELNTSPLQNVDQLLQGKMAGVNVQAVSGRPGESAKIRVRGISSITGSNEPLWVVDGVPIQKDMPSIGSALIRSGDFSTIYANGIAGINPQNIESVTVLKDAAAAAIYGSQAQAGVIVITTKGGKAGRLSINDNGSLSLQSSPTRDAKLMNSREKLAYEQSIWDEFAADGYASGGSYPVIGIVGMIRSGYGRFAGWTKQQQDDYIAQLGTHTTDWFKELFRTTTSTSHNISLSGGTEKQTYYVSGGYTTNNGIVKKTSSDSYTLSAKINGNPLDNLSYGVSMDFSYLKAMSPSQSFDIFKYAYFANPYERPYNDDGSYTADETYFAFYRANGNGTVSYPANGVNVLREIDGSTMKNTSSSTVLRADITWRPLKGLRLYGLASATFSSDNSDCVINPDTYAAWIDRPFEGSHTLSQRTYGSKTLSDNTNKSWLARFQANYGITLNKVHRLSALAGTEIRYNKATSTGSKLYGYDAVTGNHQTPLYYASAADGKLSASEVQSYRNIINGLGTYGMTRNAFASFYGAADYSYKDKYVLNATVRSDGSNNFGSNEQFNLTWSVGAAWNIDEEPFFAAVKPVVNRATLRLSTGLTGGVNKSVYPQIIMTYGQDYYEYGESSYRIGYISNAPNPNLRWEHTQDFNGSLDLGFLNDRLGLYVSAYRRRGYDLVSSVQVVSTTGFTSQSYNTTEQINQGIEMTLNAVPLKTKDFHWSVSVNAAYNQNYISKYNSPYNGTVTDDLGKTVVEDYPQGAIFSGKKTGIDPLTGIYNFKLRPDVEITKASDWRNYKNYIYYLGTGNAPWTGGLSTNATYKGLTLSISSSFSLGSLISNKISAPHDFDDVPRPTTNGGFGTEVYDLYTAYYNKPKEAANRWTADNPITNGYPRLIDAHGTYLGLDVDQPRDLQILEAIYYESGSYFKLGSVMLAYSLPTAWIRNLGLSSVSVSCTANNLFYITSYSGLNPESPGAVYPISKSFSFGINIGL